MFGLTLTGALLFYYASYHMGTVPASEHARITCTKPYQCNFVRGNFHAITNVRIPQVSKELKYHIVCLSCKRQKQSVSLGPFIVGVEKLPKNAVIFDVIAQNSAMENF